VMPWSTVKRKRPRAIIIAAVTLWAVPAIARPPAAERTAAALMSVEHQWLTALQRHDVTTLARILGREFIDSDFQGDAITRAQFLRYFSQPLPHLPSLPRQTFQDTKVRFVADGDVAIVTGVVLTRLTPALKTGRSSSPGGLRHSRFTDVFVWRDGRWQAVTVQETHFTPPAG
jgi:hypothetical protein